MENFRKRLKEKTRREIDRSINRSIEHIPAPAVPFFTGHPIRWIRPVRVRSRSFVFTIPGNPIVVIAHCPPVWHAREAFGFPGSRGARAAPRPRPRPRARRSLADRRSRERARVKCVEPESEKNSARISRRLARDARAGYARDLLIDTSDGARGAEVGNVQVIQSW